MTDRAGTRASTAGTYDLAWRLDPASPQVRGRTTIRFAGARERVDLAADRVLAASLNGRPVRPDSSPTGGDGDNVLRVEALFPFRDRGFRRVVDPADGQVYLYATNFPDAVSRTMGGFGDPGDRADVALTVTVPPSWRCLANGRAVVDAGAVRTFTPVASIARSTVAAAAGPFARVDESVHVPRSRAAVDGAAVADVVTSAIAFYENLLGPYPYAKCDVVFVPGLSSLALSTPGLILVDLPVLDRLDDPRYATVVLGHEVAHAWVGNLVDFPAPLTEGLATYLSRLFAEHTGPWDDLPDHSLPDRPYRPHLDRVRAVEAAVGRPALLRGLRAALTDLAHGRGTEADLTTRWVAAQE
ncbi:M1 family aminopeptidase [Actinosynnema sp. NPDC004786]